MVSLASAGGRSLAIPACPATIPAPKHRKTTAKNRSHIRMPRPQSSRGGGRERRERKEQFQSFSRPKIKIARHSASGKTYIDYKDTESLRKMVSGNGKILSRKRTGATAMEQRMIARAVKRARYMALLPYVTSAF